MGKRKPMTGTQRKRNFDDRVHSIDAEMNAAIAKINFKRRKAAQASLSAWVKTYGVPLLLQDPPPPLGEQVLEQMEKTITAHQKYMLCLFRGSGKTSYTQLTALYAIATGKQKYVVIISNNQRAANNILADIFRMVQEPGTPFAQDYPELTLPFQLCGGFFRRTQTYNGVSTDIQKNAAQIVFPRLRGKDGKENSASGSIITCRGIGSGLRGMKHGTLRPDFVMLDDLQDAEQARNPDAVEKLIETIKKDVIPLGGKQRLSILQTATPICPDDLVEKIRQDKSWNTTTFPAVISFPHRMDMWQEYFTLYDAECVESGGQNHDESLAFYRENFDAMNEGAEVFNPTRYSESDGHISAIQKLLELQHTLGDNVFQSEYQMSPVSLKFAIPISPELVASRRSHLRELEIPQENVQFVCAASDLNVSKYITTVIMVFMRNHTSVVVWRKFKKCRIPANIPPEDYASRLYNLLSEHGRELKALGIPIQAWSIDANGTAWNAVTQFARNAMKICGIPACAFVGKASHLYRSFMRTRLKEDVNRTLLCGDEQEHKKAGTGKKYTFFDSDFYHEKVQQGFMQELGNLGSISWYDGGDNAKWAVQVCGEKLIMKKERSDGTTEYTWKSNGPDHDALDAIGQCLATHASMGFATSATGVSSVMKQRHRFPRKRVKIV